MVIQLHTPEGIIEIDSETVTDEKLTELHLTREALNELIPRNLVTEVDEIKAKIADYDELKARMESLESK